MLPLPKKGAIAALVLAALSLLSAGCADRRALIEAFPTARIASPWVLDGAVWSGPFAAAEPALGTDADRWKKFSPERVWLAVYRHESRPQQRLTIRIQQYAAKDAAHQAYAANATPPRAPFKAGDEGCWTSDGVLFRWGRLVVEAFATDEKAAPVAEQAVYLVGFLEKRMPPGLPENPR